MATFGWTIADKEAGDITLDKALIEVSEQMGETQLGPTTLVREQTNEGIKYDKTGINALDGLEEASEVFGE